MSKSFLHIAAFAIAGLIILSMPALLIWSLNLLFGMDIPHKIETYLAAYVLLAAPNVLTTR